MQVRITPEDIHLMVQREFGVKKIRDHVRERMKEKAEEVLKLFYRNEDGLARLRNAAEQLPLRDKEVLLGLLDQKNFLHGVIDYLVDSLETLFNLPEYEEKPSGNSGNS